MGENVKIVVFTPSTHADSVRETMGNAGAGALGNYSHCSFSTKGTGRFKPDENANPHLGKANELEEAEEEKIEVLCPREMARTVIDAAKEAHPYEEVALDILPLIDETEL